MFLVFDIQYCFTGFIFSTFFLLFLFSLILLIISPFIFLSWMLSLLTFNFLLATMSSSSLYLLYMPQNLSIIAKVIPFEIFLLLSFVPQTCI